MARVLPLLLLLLLFQFLYSTASARYISIRTQPDLYERAIDTAREPSAPTNVLRQQYRNPAETLSVLLLIGGDIVQKAIAQLVGGSRITPVAFSFGWVSYAFIAVGSAFGDGTLMPLPDFPCTVINLFSGNARQNESWVIGRLLRDLELEYNSELAKGDRKPMMTILKTVEIPGRPGGDMTWWSFVLFIPLQLGIAAIPVALPRRNWTILMVTIIGIILATLTSSLPQWADEKFQCRKNTNQCYVITRGNGHQHIFVIKNGNVVNDKNESSKEEGIGLNLEDLAVPSPATTLVTRVSTILLAICWVFFLITVGGLKKDAWFLLGVGGLGMVHNVFVASRKRSPKGNGVPLEKCGRIPKTRGEASTMDILKSGENELAGLGILLLHVFFPGNMNQEESMYWTDKKTTLSERQEALKTKLDNAGQTTTVVSSTAPTVQDQTVQSTNTPPTVALSGRALYHLPSQMSPGGQPPVAPEETQPIPVQRSQTLHISTKTI